MVETCSTGEVVDQIDSKEVATVCAIPEEDRKKETRLVIFSPEYF